ncbi:MAG: hypothetical protein ACTS6J_08325, partial [Burkholderiales bacterium]
QSSSASRGRERCSKCVRGFNQDRRSARTGFRPRRFWEDLRAARANRDFRADEKHIRTEITVMDKDKDALGLILCK